jgi:hypothetical protein
MELEIFIRLNRPDPDPGEITRFSRLRRHPVRMTKTREQLDDALNRLEDSIPELIRKGQEAEVATEIARAAEVLEAKLADRDRRHYEQRVKLILWNAGILAD